MHRGADITRTRLTNVSSNGRIGHWEVALEAWREEQVHGHGAGHLPERVERPRRETTFQVLDAHSLYVETLSELGRRRPGAAPAGPRWALLVGLVLAAGRGRTVPAVAAVLAAASTVRRRRAWTGIGN